MNKKYKESQEQVNLRVSRWRERNRIHSRELNNKEYQKNRAKRLIYKKEYNLKNKEKIKSHNLAKSITFEKSICSKCGSTENIIKHHEDYSKPLEVILLCKKCHNRLHKSVQETDKVRVTAVRDDNNPLSSNQSRPDIQLKTSAPLQELREMQLIEKGAKAERERILKIINSMTKNGIVTTDKEEIKFLWWWNNTIKSVIEKIREVEE